MLTAFPRAFRVQRRGHKGLCPPLLHVCFQSLIPLLTIVTHVCLQGMYESGFASWSSYSPSLAASLRL